MAHSDLIDSLIATYRTLNLAIRPMSVERASQLQRDGTSLLSVMRELRDR